MVCEVICPKCQKVCDSKTHLAKHLERKIPCDAGKYQCEECMKRFTTQSYLSNHKKICKGRQLSYAEKDKQIEELKIVLAATGNQRLSASSGLLATDMQDKLAQTIDGDQINHIQNNIFVLPLGRENIAHIQKLTISELQSAIGLKSDPSTMIKLFELIRTDENHPENHTMLLPDLNGQTVHCKREDGWQTETFNNGMHRAIHADNSFLIRKLPDDFANKSFQDGYLMEQVQQKINFCDHQALKSIYDGVRASLHALTMKLAAQYQSVDEVKAVNRDDEHQTDEQVDIELQKLEAKFAEERLKIITKKRLAIAL